MIGRSHLELVISYAETVSEFGRRALARPDILAPVACAALGAVLLIGPGRAETSLAQPQVQSEAAAPKDPFVHALEQGYRGIAERAQSIARFAIAYDFEKRAMQVAERGDIAPYKPGGVTLHEGAVDAEHLLGVLHAVLTRGGRIIAPEASARAVVAYDCVVRASSPDGSADLGEACAAEFDEAVSDAKQSEAEAMERAADAAAAWDAETPIGFVSTPSTPSMTPTGVDVDLFADGSGVFADIETGGVASTVLIAPPPAFEAAETFGADPKRATYPEKVVFFKAGSTRLTFRAMFLLSEIADAVAKEVRAGRRVVVRLVGPADTKGDPEVNDRVSKRRAKAAYRWLSGRLRLRMSKATFRRRVKIEIEGQGEARPAIDKGDEADIGSNRRVEVFVESHERS